MFSFLKITRVEDFDSRIEILKSIHLFKEVDHSTLVKIARVLEPCEYKKDECLFNKGDRDYSLYIVVRGKVKAHDGNHTFATFGPSQYFGEYSLLDSSARSTTVTAIEDTSLLRLNQEQFNKFLYKIPSLSRALLLGLVWRLRDYNVLEAELTAKNIEIKRQKEEIDIQRKELEQLNQMKDKFFAIIAHDLKNPFSTVLSLSELLAKEFASFDQNNLQMFIEQIYKYSNKTFNLLENLLQWSMLQTGRLTPKPQMANLADVINDTVDLLKGNAINKSINLYWASPTDAFAFFDVNMITTVVRNLISNAIKFTPQNGEVVVRVDAEPEFYKISVTDTGVGMTNDTIQKLFRIDSNPTTLGTNEESGTGLGLILCKEFVEKNGGTIGVRSEVNKGTTFYFTVPRFEKKMQ
ncbi:MAG: ATP-binding protein [Bacteroidota bacterium]